MKHIKTLNKNSKLLLYGHTHNNTDDLHYETIGHKLNVNGEFSDFKPNSVISIIDRFERGELK